MYLLIHPSPWHKLCFLGNQTSSSALYLHLGEEKNSGCKTGFYKPPAWLCSGPAIGSRAELPTGEERGKVNGREGKGRNEDVHCGFGWFSRRSLGQYKADGTASYNMTLMLYLQAQQWLRW